MASSLKIYLTPEQIIQQKPNSRVVYIDVTHSRNSLGIPFLVYCSTSELKLDKNVLKVCIYNGIWHTISSEGKRPYLVGPAPSVHDYDLDDNPIDEQSASSDEEDSIDQTIRNSPIRPVLQLERELSKGKNISLKIPKQTKQTVATVKSTTSTKPPQQQTIQQLTSQLAGMTTTQTAQTTTTTQTAPTNPQTVAAATTSTAPQTVAAQQITDAFNIGLKHIPGGGGGGGGSG